MSTRGVNGMDKLTDIIANGLMHRHARLQIDEGRIIAYAYIILGRESKSMIGNPITPPDGYLDSTVGLDFLDNPSGIKEFCKNLIGLGFLLEHPDQRQMVRISPELIPECTSCLPHV